MQKRRLGQTEILVSPIGLGTVKLGRNQGVRYPEHFDLPTDREIIILLDSAFELGINVLDTAPAYGRSEERLGKYLQGKRHDWVISTKVGESFINGQSHFDFSEQGIKTSIESSLKRLGTDYLDIVLIHSDGQDEDLILNQNVFEVLDKEKQKGKVRTFGMSTKTIRGGLLTVDHADVVMVAFNINYTDEQEVIIHAHQNNKGVFIKKALASGHLSHKDAIDFVIKQKGVSSIIIGTINPSHLQENVKNVVLSPSDLSS